MIPNKLYYSISEVCTITGLEPHVLRYWESEFSQLRPKKNRAGNRAYREKDIELIQYIKHLLYEEKFTIPGAKKRLSESKSIPAVETDQENTESNETDSVVSEVQQPVKTSAYNVSEIKKELNEILQILKPS